MYVVKADYKSRISTDLLDKVLTDTAQGHNPADILAAVSKSAEDTIASYAGVLYDIAPELAKAGADRNGLVLTWALNIATYEVYQRIDDEEVPGKVIKNYDDTFELLEKVAKGTFPLNLPPKPPAPGEGGSDPSQPQGTGLRRIGSRAKRSHEV